MSSPRIVPAVLIGFALLAACLWYYGRVIDPPVANSKLAAGGAIHQSDPVSQRSASAIPVGDIAKPAHRTIAPDASEQFEMVMLELEDAANRLRSNVRGSAAGRFVAGIQCSLENQHGAAIARYDAALRRAPDDPIILAAKAKSLLALGRRDDAAGLFQTLVERDPEDTAAWYNLAVSLIREGRLEDASEALRRVVRLAPDHGPAQYNLASLAQRAGRLLEARQAWEAYTKLEPEVPSSWFHLGVTWMDYGRPGEAAKCFSRYTALATFDPLGHVNLGLALAALGDEGSALEVFRVADELDPCNPLILANLYVLHEHIAAREGEDSTMHRNEADRLAKELLSLEGGSIAIPAIVGRTAPEPEGEHDFNSRH